MYECRERCVRAVQSKDARFDGWFFTAVLTTKIYCRPSCPVVPPKVENMRFYPSAAAAQQAGFRACKRCRPDASPGSPEWNDRADLVARAMRLIADGVVDRDGVPGLATRLGYSVRQVQRQLLAELGAGPLALARAQRAQTARLLIETSELQMADVAFAAGFSSVRTFNETVQEVFALAPTDLRRRARRGTSATAPGTISLRLPFRAPLTPDNLFGHLIATGVPGVEEWRDGHYRRTLRLPHGHGVVALRPMPDHIACQLSLTDQRDLAIAISRCRRMLDLDADPVAVDDLLSTDPVLAPLIAKAPGPARSAHGRRRGVRRPRGPRSAGVDRSRSHARASPGPAARRADRGSGRRAHASVPDDAGAGRAGPGGAGVPKDPTYDAHYADRHARERRHRPERRRRLGSGPRATDRTPRDRAVDGGVDRDARAG
ncbi:methylphosphotriester-DNA--protein-cysteine methyltransferase [Kribbella aluminosa]|uniref:Methylphosphotriester-DNA--protein-cysteine methyltransferase n=1 Tax=Kribbella aluminosa TaxID=416017 RepID=A0ABS4UEA0_9ACTN|nr:AlkA N-terminal domain-containing protein [Kribbella aluminosa]MBP2349977.1 methylphosphotriester-DNA--protein-cysteine methyltransferase [Kribbella aluminosa]